MSDVTVIQLRNGGEPTKPARSVAQLAKHLGVSFAASDLQLSTIALGRKIESLEFELALLRHEVRRPLWKRAVDRLKGNGDEKG